MSNRLTGKERFFAIVNPAAGGGRCAKLAGPALSRLREAGLGIDVIASTGPGHAVQLAREAFEQGYRRFLAVGGDGTAHEILNGVFAYGQPAERVALGFLPLGTGNSFLRDFAKDSAEASMRALLAGRTRAMDLNRLRHAGGELYSINILSVGFTADVAVITNRWFKPLGHYGYLLGVLVRIAQLRRYTIALRCDGDAQWDERRCLFLAFCNSKHTGGSMLVAPQADPADGKIEFIRWGAIGRWGAITTLPGIYDGSHLRNPLAERREIHSVEFRPGTGALDVMMDGEVTRLECQRVDVLPGAVDIYI